MGTRSLTILKDENDKEIAVLYRQFDGYPNGHGLELAKFLQGTLIVNGMRGDEPQKFANGLACLAAQVVAHFKTEPGGFYLYPAGTRCCGEDYIYSVMAKIGDKEPKMSMVYAHDPSDEPFNGYPSEFLKVYGGGKD